MSETAREFAEKMREHTAKSLLSAEEWMEESASLVAALLPPAKSAHGGKKKLDN